MNCAEYLELINLHIDGQCTPEQEQQLQAHLAECAQCRALLSAYEEITSGVASLECEPPERFASGVMYRVSQEAGGASAKKKRFAFGHGTAFAAVAAVLVILIGTGMIELPRWRAGSDRASTEATTANSTAGSDAAESAQISGAIAYDAAETNDAAVAEEQEKSADGDETDGASNEFLLMTPEAAEASDSADSAEDSMLTAESEIAAEDSADAMIAYAVYAELQGYSESEPIPELDSLEQAADDPTCYYGTAAEILQIVRTYESVYRITCSEQSDHAASDPACLVILP